MIPQQVLHLMLNLLEHMNYQEYVVAISQVYLVSCHSKTLKKIFKIIWGHCGHKFKSEDLLLNGAGKRV